MRKPKRRKSKIVRTSDPDWFMGDTVTVSLLRDGKGDWRVTVWGPDDLGMELEGSMDACLSTYRKIGDGISVNQLEAFKFKNAS